MELFVTLFTAVANILLGLLTFLKNPKSSTNRLFLLLTLIISSWAVSNYFSLHASSLNDTLFWIRVVMVITTPLGPTIFLLVQAFPGSVINLKKKYLYALVGFVGLVTLLAMTPLMFSSVSIVNGNITPQPGPAILLFALSFAGGPVAAFITLFLKYRRSRGLTKVQVRYFLLGIIATFSLMVITNFLFVILLHISYFVVFGPMFSLILVGFIAYAIIRHRFLDISAVLLRSLVYSLVITVIAVVYALIIFSFGRVVNPTQFAQYNLIISIVFTLVVTFSFQPLQGLFQKITETVFFKPTYKVSELLQELSQIMAANIVLQDLARLLLHKLQASMKMSAVALVLLEKDKARILVTQTGEETFLGNSGEYGGLIHSAAHDYATRLTVFDELPESPTKDLMRKLNINIILPLVVQDEIIGAVLVGERSSGEIYSSEDINVLEIMAPQVAVAVKNALSYEEIKNFNVTLAEEVKRATTELKAANEHLKELDHLKDEFVSVASHELRTPMTAVKSYLWLALHNAPQPLSEEVTNYLNIAYNSTERLIHLVQEMLTISRIEGNRLELHRTNFNMFEVLKQMYDELKIKADEKKISFVIPDGTKEVMLEADKDKIREVIQNLTGNALKFTPEGGEVKIGLQEKDGKVMVTVQDNGPGVPAEDIHKLFQKFSKLESSYKKTKEAGTGLGLYISKQIVELHGGTIEVESEVNKRTVFTVTLPVKTPPALQAQENQAAAAAAAAPAPSPATSAEVSPPKQENK